MQKDLFNTEGTLTGTTTPNQGKPEIMALKGVPHTLQNQCLARFSLVSYWGEPSLGIQISVFKAVDKVESDYQWHTTCFRTRVQIDFYIVILFIYCYSMVWSWVN